MAFKVKYLASRGSVNDQRILEQTANGLEAEGYGEIVAVVPIVRGDKGDSNTEGFLVLARSEGSTYR